MEMEKKTVVFDKDGLTFTRMNTNHYKLTVSIENKNIVLSKVIDFGLIKLIYDLNTDIYENFIFERINDNEANVMLLMKNFFEDLGLSQKFSYLHIKKVIKDNEIVFKSQTIKSHRPIVPEDSELMEIQDMENICTIISPHKVIFNYNIIFEEDVIIPQFVEKMAGTILNKIFKRVKQFIENLRV